MTPACALAVGGFVVYAGFVVCIYLTAPDDTGAWRGPHH